MNSLPKDWKFVELKTLCDLQNGYAFQSGDYISSSNTLNCRMSNIRPDGEFDLDYHPKFLPDSYAQKYSKYLLNDGDVIIAMTDMATEAKILGVPTVVKTQGKNLLLNQRVGKLVISNPDEVYFPYLKYALNRDSVRKYYLRFAGGGLQLNLSKDDLLSVKIPLPPIAEQKRIAAILDKADAIRRKRQEAIKLTEELGRSLFLDMFGDPVTNPKGWDVVELEKLLVFMTTGSRGWAKYYSTKGQLFLRIQNVKNGRLLLEDVAYVNAPDSAEARRTCVKEGDVLVSMTADLGRTAVIPKGLNKAFVNQHLGILRLKQDQISSVYLSSFLTSEGGQIQFSKLNREGVKAGLNFDDIKSLKILVPPVYIQKKYESLFHFLMNTLGKYKEGLNYNENLFNSLLQRAFKGEL